MSALFTMTTFTFRDGLMIPQLVFYTPALVLSTGLTVWHGVWQRTGFIYLALGYSPHQRSLHDVGHHLKTTFHRPLHRSRDSQQHCT
jgi:hypothetical protein